MSELSAPHTKSQNFCLPIQRQLNPSTIRFARAATYAIFFGDGLGFGVWAGQIPIFKQKFHLGDAQSSVALFAVALGAIVAMPIVGHTLRRFGSRALTGFCASLYAIAIACLAHAPSYPLFVLGTALLGACKGSLDVSINAQAVGVESAYGRPIMSSFQAAWSVGGLTGAALAGATLRSRPWRQRKSRRSRRFHPSDCFLERSLSHSGKGCRADQFAGLAGQSSPQRCGLHVSGTLQ